MAIPLLEINAFTHNYIVPLTTDTIFKNSPVFTRLQSKRMQRFSGGNAIQRPITIGELNGDAIGRGDAVNIDFIATEAALVLNMKAYWVNITLFGLDSMANDGPEAVFSQVENKFTGAASKMAKMLAVNMYKDGSSNAARSKHLNGFDEWIDDGNTFPAIGGINRSDILPVGTIGGLNASTNLAVNAFTLSTVNNAYGDAWFGNDHVDLIAATQAGWNGMWNATQPAQRYKDETSDIGVIGFQSFRFNAAQVVVDKYMPLNTMFGLNTDYIEWYLSDNQQFQFGFTGFKETADTIDVAGQYLCGSNLVVPNPRSCFKLKGTAL